MATHFKRRDFLNSALATAGLFTAGGAPRLVSDAYGAFRPLDNRLLINVMLAGGPDWRHVFPPALSTKANSYGARFWSSRAAAYAIRDTASERAKHWNTKFHHVSHKGVDFGILKSCDWLKKQWDLGNLAIVCNVVGSTTRDHEHAILVMDQGNLDSTSNDFERSGWGGRLASAADGNVVSVTYVPRDFCFGLHPSGDINLHDKANLISSPDTRSLGLYEVNHDMEWDEPTQISRALSHYYRALRNDLPSDSPARRFLAHEKKVRLFGRQMRARLTDVPEPKALRNLYHWDSPNRLRNSGFGLQLRSLYDAIAANDILNMRVASLEYGNWDSHDAQATQIEPQLIDMFGKNRGFDTLFKSLPASSRRNAVVVMAGEFGRQLVANGANGTDHGRGNSVLVIGEQVRGGVYGTMFPQSELARWNDVSADIDGLTELDHVFGEACNWTQAGTASAVFPSIASRDIERNLNLGTLFS